MNANGGGVVAQRSSPELRNPGLHPRSSGELRYFPVTRRHLATRLYKSYDFPVFEFQVQRDAGAVGMQKHHPGVTMRGARTVIAFRLKAS